jgi:putative MATE family efflux protein
MSARTEIELTDGNIPKKMLAFAWPLIISGWLQLSFSLADFIVCGQFVDNNAVGAIGATGSVTSLIVDLFIGFGVGVDVVMGNAYGEKDKAKGNRIISSSLALALFSGLFLMVIGVTMSKTFLTWMDTPANLLDMANTYMMIYFGGLPFLLIYNFGAAAMRGMGDTTKPFIYLTIGGVMNVGLNLLFVIVFHWGVAGLAYATIITEGVSAALVVISLIRNRGGFAYMEVKNFRFYKDETSAILRIGLPAGIQNAMYDIANVLIQSKINSFGSNVVSGDSAAGRINGYIYVAMDAFAQAGVAFISANVGAKKVENIKTAFKWSLIYACIVDGILGAIYILLRRQLVSVIVSNEESIETGELNILITISTHLLMACVDVLSSSERGLGHSMLPAITSFVGICVLRIIYVYTIFNLPELHTMTWLYAAYPISWGVTGIAHGVCYYFVSKKEFARISSSKIGSGASSLPLKVEPCAKDK